MHVYQLYFNDQPGNEITSDTVPGIFDFSKDNFGVAHSKVILQRKKLFDSTLILTY
jgi:hypothetical protein